MAVRLSSRVETGWLKSRSFWFGFSMAPVAQSAEHQQRLPPRFQVFTIRPAPELDVHRGECCAAWSWRPARKKWRLSACQQDCGPRLAWFLHFQRRDAAVSPLIFSQACFTFLILEKVWGVFFVFVVPVDQRLGFMLSFCLLKLHSILLNGF